MWSHTQTAKYSPKHNPCNLTKMYLGGTKEVSQG
jgi:hypothetical protein